MGTDANLLDGCRVRAFEERCTTGADAGFERGFTIQKCVRDPSGCVEGVIWCGRGALDRFVIEIVHWDPGVQAGILGRFGLERVREVRRFRAIRVSNDTEKA